jgi:hypothetical protein
MSNAETNTDTEVGEKSPSLRGTLAAIAYFTAAGLTTLAWLGFLIWIVLALFGF